MRDFPPIRPDRYRPLRWIADGATSRVWYVEDVTWLVSNGKCDEKSPKKLAIKLLKPEWAHDQQLVSAFATGARAAMKIRDKKNIICIHEVSMFGDRPYVVMDYGGQSLEILARQRLYESEPALAIRIALQVQGGWRRSMIMTNGESPGFCTET